MDTDEMESDDNNSIDEFITQMNHSDQYKNIFKIMVKGRRLFFRVQGMNEDFDPESFIYYYVNKLKEEYVEKFTEFKQVQITVFKLKS